ncbi:Limonene 1,2-monooxygenase [Chryseobacterium nakagawai]|uniref:MsnO8 family LLM class oxidoreductase n=1 Tax=Chryseobacterium nakagawai TaxID=1241982 RepID=A0AAD0YR50_CHRNA|nr:MsnO8 family LLM class oxidoreductase [Chryseobacterium nakagawai]AZA93645.1 MsnO8 family LLM class oxidoreductase [Chryseobacterium nakagawai]VEH20350.1 Limonene 1,2-monooxygenase [Chryseobacterium nakagawai]
MELKLSILDQTPIIKGGNATLALKNSLALAEMADTLGYNSILYSEHHGVEAYGSSSPEILAATALANTKNIKVGTGGIMLRNYSAFKIAEWAKMLATFYPDRFILGLGKAPGGLKDAILALNGHKLPVLNNINDKLEEIITYLKEQNYKDTELFAQPTHVITLPEITWLGSGESSAKEAAQYGISYSMADFIADGSNTEIQKTYQKEFNDKGYGSQPSFQVAVSVSVAKNIEQALRNAFGMVYQFVESRKILAPAMLKPSEEVETLIAKSEDKDLFNTLLNKVIVGTPDTIHSKLKEKALQYGTNDLVILSNMFREEDRIFTYKSLI